MNEFDVKWTEGDGDLDDAYLIRRSVFVEEQGVPVEEEYDGTDKNAIHLVLYCQCAPIATGRLLFKGEKIYLGRIAVLLSWRNRHLGEQVVKLLVNKAEELGFEQQYLNSQDHAQGFYEKLGFICDGEPFIEADILHIPMCRKKK